VEPARTELTDDRNREIRRDAAVQRFRVQGRSEHAWQMGGENRRAVISLNMAGSVPDAADLVISDPVQDASWR
jgi:hypothetical protein